MPLLLGTNLPFGVDDPPKIAGRYTHIGSGKFCCKHFSDCIYPNHGIICHLMVGCVIMV